MLGGQATDTRCGVQPGPGFAAAGDSWEAGTPGDPHPRAQGLFASACGRRAGLLTPLWRFSEGRPIGQWVSGKGTSVLRGSGVLGTAHVPGMVALARMGTMGKGSVIGADVFEPWVFGHGPVQQRDCGSVAETQYPPVSYCHKP